MAIEFNAVPKRLSDDSMAFDVEVADDDEDISLNVFAAPSENTAETTASAMNNLLEAFQLCANETQVAALYVAVKLAISSVLDK